MKLKFRQDGTDFVALYNGEPLRICKDALLYIMLLRDQTETFTLKLKRTPHWFYQEASIVGDVITIPRTYWEWETDEWNDASFSVNEEVAAFLQDFLRREEKFYFLVTKQRPK